MRACVCVCVCIVCVCVRERERERERERDVLGGREERTVQVEPGRHVGAGVFVGF